MVGISLIILPTAVLTNESTPLNWLYKCRWIDCYMKRESFKETDIQNVAVCHVTALQQIFADISL